MLLPPKIPGFTLIRRLGGGAITSVFEAREEESGSPCAVKLIRPDFEDQEMARQLLRREARIGLSLRHPNIVRVTQAQVLKPPCFLVMDLLSGEPVRHRLQGQLKLTVAEALGISRQAAEALSALHDAGILHGDVKPDNLTVLPDETVILTDLGFAHRPGENAALIRDGYLLGTANYLAPEQCEEWPSEEPASDLFSLGVSLFEMLTGCLPYPAGNVRQTILRHRNDRPTAIRALVRGLPRALADLVDALLAREPEDRPSVKEVIQTLVELEIADLWARARKAG
jgi:serine/threonine protein kinase